MIFNLQRIFVFLILFDQSRGNLLFEQFSLFENKKKKKECFDIFDKSHRSVIICMDVCVPLNPENKKFLRLIYLICQSGDDADDDKNWFDNGRFEAPENESNTIESGCQRISLAAMMVQYFYWKTTGKTFRLEFDQQERKENRRPIVYRFLIKDHDHHKLWQMNQIDLWRLIANQLMNSTLATNDCKYLAFCSFSRFASKSNQPIWLPSKQVNGYVSLGGDGLALLSTHCLYCWPETIDEINERFEDQRPVDVDRFMNDSNNRLVVVMFLFYIISFCFLILSIKKYSIRLFGNNIWCCRS